MTEQAAIDYDYELMRAGWRSSYTTAQTWIFQLVRVLLRFMTLLVHLTSLVILLRLFLLLHLRLYFILQQSLARLQVLLRRLMCLLRHLSYFLADEIPGYIFLFYFPFFIIFLSTFHYHNDTP
jgi:hypothetical protein